MAKCKRNRNRAKRNFTFKKHQRQNRSFIKDNSVFRMLFSDWKICSRITMQSIRVIIKPGRFGDFQTLENAILYGNKNDLVLHHGYESVSVW